VSCLYLKRELNATVIIHTTPRKKYSDEIQGYDQVYLFDTNFNTDEITRLCLRNSKVTAISPARRIRSLVESKTNPINLEIIYASGDSCISAICCKLKLRDTAASSYIANAVQKNPLPNIKEVCEFLRLGIPFNAKKLENAISIVNADIEYAVSQGSAIIEYKEHQVDEIVKFANNIIFEGHDALILNCSEYVSEVTNALAKKSASGLGMTWRAYGKNFKFTICSSHYSGIDCRALAINHGGSGYDHLAGFTAPTIGLLSRILDGIYNKKD